MEVVWPPLQQVAMGVDISAAVGAVAIGCCRCPLVSITPITAYLFGCWTVQGQIGVRKKKRGLCFAFSRQEGWWVRDHATPSHVIANGIIGYFFFRRGLVDSMFPPILRGSGHHE